MSTFSVDLKGEIGAYIKKLNSMQHKAIAPALSSTLNKTAVTVRAQSRRYVAQEMGLAQKEIAKSFFIKRASAAKQRAEVVVNPKQIPLSKFRGVKQVAAGVSHAAYNRKQTASKAFIANVKYSGGGSHRGVFVRKTKKRLPIKQLYGPSPSWTFASAVVERFNQETSRRRFNEIFPKELSWRLSKLK